MPIQIPLTEILGAYGDLKGIYESLSPDAKVKLQLEAERLKETPALANVLKRDQQKTADLENSENTLRRIILQNMDSLGSMTLASYGAFLKKLPSRVREILEAEEGNRKLVVEDLDYSIPEKIIDYDYISRVKDENGDLTIPLRGVFALYEDDKLIDRSKPRLVARIPFPTRDGNFVLGGREFTVKKQLRLSPGVYTSKRHDGRINSMINTSRRQSANIYLDPQSHKLSFHIGGKTFPLYSVMKAIGAKDEDMRRAWGREIYESNVTSPRKQRSDMERLYKTMHHGHPAASGEDQLGIIRAFAESKIDPWVTKRTLGKKYDHIDKNMLLETTRKMMRVSSGKEDSDNREAMFFKKPFDIGMMVDYALDKQAGRLGYKLRQRLRDRKDLDSILSRPLKVLGNTIIRKYNQDELAHTPDQYNPLGIYSDTTEVTVLGEGGLRSRFQAKEEMRDIDDSMIGFIDPLHTPEGAHLGMNIHLTNRANIAGSKILMHGLVTRNGEKTAMTPREMYDKKVALPGQLDFKNGKPVLGKGKIDVLHKGRITKATPQSVDVVISGTPAESFGISSFVPFAGYDAGNRLSTAIKHMGQAVPLVDPEAPLVRSMAKDGKAYTELFYRKMNPTVPKYIKSGTVKQVRQNAILIEDDDGETHRIPIRRDYQLNGNASIQEKPVVSAGDRVTAGQVLAENQWSRDGNLALGTNLDVAYVPYYGYNHQDGLVISESAAKKLTSQHSYAQEFSRERGEIYSKKKFLAHYPNRYNRDQVKKLDNDGVIKEGEVLEPGDPIALKLSPQEITEDDIIRGRISRIFKKPLRDDDKTWDSDYPAVVKRVIKTNNGIKVILGTTEPAKVGDKLSGFHGQRGVITKVMEDEKMPRYEDGSAPDILQNPAAVPSRMNSGQIMESAAARLARATGQPYMVNNFMDRVNSKTLRQELLKHGLAEEDEKGEIDARRSLTLDNGKKVKVLTGPQYFMKMKQLAAEYYGARGRKDQYDVVSRRPIKGPKVDPLGLYAMLSHGATKNLQEMGGVKSEKNDDFWRLLETGAALPSPKTTFAMDKLIGLLKGAGINVRETGDSYQLLPLTDRDVEELSNGEIPDPTKGVRINKAGSPQLLSSYKGGLYDQKIFGGMTGEEYGHINLADSMPNPVFEKPIKKLLDLTTKEYRALISGDKGVVDGSVVDVTPENEKHAKVRSGAFRELLSRIDVPREMRSLSRQYKTARGARKDKVAKKLKYLNGLRQAGLNPTDYMISKIPVIPPKLRPVYLTQENDLRVSDLTSLYQKIGMQNEAAKQAGKIPGGLARENYLALYDSVRNLQKVGEAQGYQQRQSAGILRYLKGESPKSGQFMSSILSKREALGGQATIMPDPKLDVDEIRIPEEMAWEMMAPFVMRKLVQQGAKPIDASKWVEEAVEDPEKAREFVSKTLDSVLEERPILLSRDPKLHKFNYLAFRARRTPGKAIYIPSLVCKGFNADFDGDRMIAHVPVRPEAVKEAREKLMPSQNLFKPGRDRIIMQPEEEAIAGLYAATRMKNRTNRRYSSPQEVIKAYEKGQLDLNDGIKLGKELTTPGRVIVNQKLPEHYRDYSREFNESSVQQLSKQMVTDMGGRAAKYIKRIKDAGDTFATEIGLSFRMSDFDPIEDKKELVEMARKNRLQPTQAQQQAILRKLKKHIDPDSALAIMADSGAKGSWNNIQQMLYSPLSVGTATGEPAPHLIRHGYAEGMDYRDYWAAMKGARAGLVAKGIEVSKPGEFSKELIRNSLGMTVQTGDSRDVEGWEYPVDHPTVLNRYLAADVKAGGRTIARANTPVTPGLVQTLQKAGIKKLMVRSPLTSKAPSGIYAKDFGRLPGNKKPAPGTDLGIMSAHTLTEPAVQLMLKRFHGAGAATEKQKLSGFQPVWSLLRGKAPTGQKASLAPIAGMVKSIRKLPSGAHEVTIGGKKVVTTPGLPLHIKRGQSVKKGQQLQEGYPDPRAVLAHRGIRGLQKYLVDEIDKNYGDKAPDRRYIEAVVANVTKYARVNDPGDSDYIPGEILPVNQLEGYNRKKRNEAFKVRYKPIFMGIGPSSSKTQRDWASSMIHGDIMNQLPDMAAEGATSAIKSNEPIMPFIHSETFGEEIERGRY